jgi:hypothetical protein
MDGAQALLLPQASGALIPPRAAPFSCTSSSKKPAPLSIFPTSLPSVFPVRAQEHGASHGALLPGLPCAGQPWPGSPGAGAPSSHGSLPRLLLAASFPRELAQGTTPSLPLAPPSGRAAGNFFFPARRSPMAELAQASIAVGLSAPEIHCLSTPFPLPRHILSLIYGTRQQQPWRPFFFSAQRRRSKRQQPRIPSVSLACHPLDILRSHIVVARCPTTRSPSIFPRWRSSPDVSARLAALCCAVNSTPSTLVGCLLFLRSPIVVVVHPGETTTILV